MFLVFIFSIVQSCTRSLLSFQLKTKHAPTPIVHDHDSLNQQKYFRIQYIEIERCG
jgi:hypothetical protein